MIGKKMLSWIVAGVLSVAAIPAIGATVSHRAKPQVRHAHRVIHRRAGVKAISHKTTARSRRNTVIIGALIGLILGALAALLWEPVAARVTPRNGD